MNWAFVQGVVVGVAIAVIADALTDGRRKLIGWIGGRLERRRVRAMNELAMQAPDYFEVRRQLAEAGVMTPLPSAAEMLAQHAEVTSGRLVLPPDASDAPRGR